MHAVSNAINILNSNIDAKICKDHEHSGKNAGKCQTGTGGSNGTGKKLSEWFSGSTSSGDEWHNGKKGHEPWGEHNAGVVSKNTAALSRVDI